MEQKISIIIPVYNGKQYIAETLFACDKLQYPNLEVIVIDDCSTDDSYDVMKKCLMECKNKRRFSLLQNSENSGVLKTCNKGAEIAQGTVLLFLGQDDLLPSDYLDKIMCNYDEDTAFIFCNPIVINGKGEQKHSMFSDCTMLNDQNYLKCRLTKECYIPSTGLIINASKFHLVGMFDTKYRNYGEWNLWIRLSCVGKMSFCESTSSFYRRHETNMTKSFSSRAKRKELNKYWNECRRLAVSKFNISLLDKTKAGIYYVLINMKELIVSILRG